MTIQGTVNKAFVLLILLLIPASWVWNKAFQAAPLLGEYQTTATTGIASVGGYIMVGLIGGLIAAVVTIFKKKMGSCYSANLCIMPRAFVRWNFSDV